MNVSVTMEPPVTLWMESAGVSLVTEEQGVSNYVLKDTLVRTVLKLVSVREIITSVIQPWDVCVSLALQESTVLCQ